MWERYHDRVAFCVVYIREAHPEDGWVLHVNRDEGIEVSDPISNDERHDVAATCALRLAIRMPVVIDPVDDQVSRAYGALPDRLYLVGHGGHVAFQGDMGPAGFRPDDLEAAIERELTRVSGTRS